MKNCLVAISLATLLGVLCSFASTEASVGKVMLEAMQSNNAALMTEHYAEQVEISILGKSELGSADDAEQLLRDFFMEYTIRSCQVLHHGQSANSEFYILNIVVQDQQKFRVYALLRTENEKQMIQQFRIDEAYE